jgi:16S rRNA (uracil1498-N3)-methyltransferase
MNLVLFSQTDLIDADLIEIRGRRFSHLSSVNRICKGQTLICGRLNGKIGTGTIESVSNKYCHIKVVLDQAPPKPLPLILVMALPRPKVFRRILQAITTLGVKQIHFTNSWRVEKSFWKSPVLAAEQIKEQMILGLEQSRDTQLPTVIFHRFFNDLVHTRLPDISQNTLRMVAHPKSKKVCPACVNQTTTLVIGPEGGFIDREIESLEKIGFSSYHIGSRILKVETVVTFLIGRLFS